MTATAFAAAKVNLYLHVAPPTPDGYHPIASLMAFADVGDEVSAAPAETLSLAIRGPFGAGLSAQDDNLVLRAARALLAHAGRPDAGARLVLTKALPIAAGLGGGSSDAGAALRLLDAMLGLSLGEDRLEAVAAEIGADGAACLRGRMLVAQGRGERLSPAPAMPPLPAVLVNPGAPSPTGAVYRAYDDSGAPGDADRPEPPVLDTVAAAAAWLAGCRNDLEPPALKLEPRIGEALAALAAAPESLLARMSGSGATCFALCETIGAAQTVADRLAARHPSWWVRACTLT
ncbi:MAG: 4-(cytidine 5-diphospho)-2-C-methyl-D-erythritol kinase [Caulobacteraceae bacterium]|nr:4-(cytidine 5-diphospho)-2-C-methyl-D-erythritol kinase [Caulobacteraceae bacterium]